MLSFFKKKKKKNFLKNNSFDKEKQVQTIPEVLSIPSPGKWCQVNELISEMPILDFLEAVLNRIDNLNYFALNNKGSNQKSYAFSRYDGLWKCAEDEYRNFKSKSIKEVIEYVERGGDPKKLPVLIKR
jgi:hypothetical protein